MNISSIAPYLNNGPGKEFGERHTLLTRALRAGDLEHPLRPWRVTAWADRIDLPYPVELRAAVAEIERRCTPPAPATALAIQPPNYSYLIDPREHRTLKLLVAAMAADKYGYQHGTQRQGATSRIASAVHKLGLKIDVDTVLKHLRASTNDALNDTDRNPNSD